MTMENMKKMDENMDDMKQLEEKMKEEGKDLYIIKLKNPVKFEGKTYDRIDLSGLEDIRAADMIAINKRLSGMGNDTFQENTLEYALYLAAEAASLPVEFFMQLKGNVAMRVKSCVMLFLFRQG